jgi:predicted transcriptional regulator
LLGSPLASAYIPGMATNSSARRERVAHEHRQIDEALASVAAGETVSEADFDAWVDGLGTDHELPPPRPR